MIITEKYLKKNYSQCLTLTTLASISFFLHSPIRSYYLLFPFHHGACLLYKTFLRVRLLPNDNFRHHQGHTREDPLDFQVCIEKQIAEDGN